MFEKNVNGFLYWQEISQSTQVFTAQAELEHRLQDLKPMLKVDSENLEIQADSAISLFLNDNGKEKILYEKNSDKALPIASVSKLMTALVVLDNYDLEKEIEISKTAVNQEESLGKLQEGKIFPVKYLLYPLLMESSNDAAFSLSNDYDGITMSNFVKLMNEKAQELNLQNTLFVNPSGLDPDNPKGRVNYSNVKDLTKLGKELLKKPLIWKILSTKKYVNYGPELFNTNELLDKIPGIVGGKTGYTQRANGCMFLVIKSPKNKGYVINVVLGSDNRFGDMEMLVEWVKENYNW